MSDSSESLDEWPPAAVRAPWGGRGRGRRTRLPRRTASSIAHAAGYSEEERPRVGLPQQVWTLIFITRHKTPLKLFDRGAEPHMLPRRAAGHEADEIQIGVDNSAASEAGNEREATAAHPS